MSDRHRILDPGHAGRPVRMQALSEKDNIIEPKIIMDLIQVRFDRPS
jgi:hypothetical protein